MKRFLFIVTILISISSSAQSYYDNIDLLLHEDIWSVDTLTKVDDVQYYYASSAFKNIIYNDFNILLISNTIYKPYDKEYRKLPIFTYNDSTFIVDFSKDSSVNSLLSKEQYNSNFYRVWKDFVYKVNDWFKLKHSVYIDFPKYYYAYASNIREWLIKKIECSFDSNDGNVYTDLESIGINSPNDNEIINFSAYKYFQTVLRDFQNSEFYGSQWWFYYELSLEVHTDRFVTYKYYRSRYEGGAHDAYSKNYITYDYINNREYDIEDLIKPEYLNRVKEILLITAYESGKFGEDYDYIRDLFINNIYMGNESKYNSINNMNVPKPSLHKQGIIFYYYPYWLEGNFDHEFLIPYYKILQYMTDYGKWLIGVE